MAISPWMEDASLLPRVLPWFEMLEIAVSISVLHLLIWMGLVAAIAVRAVLVFLFYRLVLKGIATDEQRWARLRNASKSPATTLFSGAQARPFDRHKGHYAASINETQTSLLVGSIALAAWTQLMAGATSGPVSRLSAMTQWLLLSSALVLLGTPAVFRTSGAFLTTVVRHFMTMLGLMMIVFSICSAMSDLLGTAGQLFGAPVVLVVAIRDWFENMMTSSALSPPRDDEPSATETHENPTNDTVETQRQLVDPAAGASALQDGETR
jgi:hypothetical protein